MSKHQKTEPHKDLIHTHATLASVVIVLILSLYLVKTNGVAAYRRYRRGRPTTTPLPLIKQGPFTINRLFEILYDKYMAYMKEDDKKKVNLSNFVNHFVSKAEPVFNATVHFVNGTFNDMSRLLIVYNKTVYGVGNNTYICDAVIECRETFIIWDHGYQTPFYYVCDLAVVMVKDPFIRVIIKFQLGPDVYKAELINANYSELRNLRYIIASLDEYSHVEDEIGEMIYAHFVKHEKPKVDAALADRFRTVIELSGIRDVLNNTSM